jgi:hypothetical protein
MGGCSLKPKASASAVMEAAPIFVPKMAKPVSHEMGSMTAMVPPQAPWSSLARGTVWPWK